ncbi:hypothetical protein K1719_011742 [Acacia pycnantha]|nr:hypothetical protein K1719_011742 [Acacia pycnantha]
MELSLVAHAHVPLSAEENDLINRSSKKIKNGEDSSYEKDWPKLGLEGGKPWGLGCSFVEKLQGVSQEDRVEEKKGGKEKIQRELRRPESGSRFGVLVEEGSGGDGVPSEAGLIVVHDVAIEKSAPRTKSVQTSRDKKGETKKKLRKDYGQIGESNEQKSIRQVTRKEKRSRYSTKGEEKGFVVLHLKNGEIGMCADNDSVESSLKIKDPLDVNQALEGALDSELDFPPVWACEKGGLGNLSRLQGKFWSGPSNLDPDLSMGSSVKGVGGEAVGSSGPGAVNKRLLRNLRSVWKGTPPDLLFIVESIGDSKSKFSCFLSIGYDGLAVIPCVGRSGGIVAAWRSEKIEVNVVLSNRQFFHMKCTAVGAPEFFLTVVYVVPSPSMKQALWLDLRNIALSMSSPWVVVGDFNDIALSTKRTGGFDLNFSRMRIFQERIQDCMLSELGSAGPKFTWRGPKLVNRPRLFQRPAASHHNLINLKQKPTRLERTTEQSFKRYNQPHLPTEAMQYDVGDSFGWNTPPNQIFYSDWARPKTFFAGDSLGVYLLYQTSFHSFAYQQTLSFIL